LIQNSKTSMKTTQTRSKLYATCSQSIETALQESLQAYKPMPHQEAGSSHWVITQRAAVR
jgi:hypothetical protein